MSTQKLGHAGAVDIYWQRAASRIHLAVLNSSRRERTRFILRAAGGAQSQPARGEIV